MGPEKLLAELARAMGDKEKRVPIPFKEFLELAAARPGIVFRNFFQKLQEMILFYMGKGENEYPDDPESINYLKYDTHKLFVEGADQPFFADRLFANRLVNMFNSLNRGGQQNKIRVFNGPHGCGKSTLLNNFLRRLEEYMNSEYGLTYEVIWRLDKEAVRESLKDSSLRVQGTVADKLRNACPDIGRFNSLNSDLKTKDFIFVRCPSHDSPLLMIPKERRVDFFDRLIADEEFKKKLFGDKEYEWVLKGSPCTICTAMFQALYDRLGSVEKVFSMLMARRYVFNRRLGEGISIFNPSDALPRDTVITDKALQEELNDLFGDSDTVKFLYSVYAKTNNGIYALMDVKENNTERLAALHGVISEGLHKVGDIEENVNSFFVVVSNPEDIDDAKENGQDKKSRAKNKNNIISDKSFRDRLEINNAPYVLESGAEVQIYKSIFGEQTEQLFLPRVLSNFAKVIISTRLMPESAGIKKWIDSARKYEKYCDSNFHLLKMDIYSGKIPRWLSEEDRRKFTAKVRREIIKESEAEGMKGITGRDAIRIFDRFISAYGKENRLINMSMLRSFFNNQECRSEIPSGFLGSLTDLYNYKVLEEVKESLYQYNPAQMSRDIIHYMQAVNFDIGRIFKCRFTGETVEVTTEFMEKVENVLLGAKVSGSDRQNLRKEVSRDFSTRTMAQEINVQGRKITETEQYQVYYDLYVQNLKERVLDPFKNNENFRSCIKDYGTPAFSKHGPLIRQSVNYMMDNLQKKSGYTEQGAKEVCIYVIDNELAEKFSKR